MDRLCDQHYDFISISDTYDVDVQNIRQVPLGRNETRDEEHKNQEVFCDFHFVICVPNISIDHWCSTRLANKWRPFKLSVLRSDG